MQGNGARQTYSELDLALGSFEERSGFVTSELGTPEPLDEAPIASESEELPTDLAHSQPHDAEVSKGEQASPAFEEFDKLYPPPVIAWEEPEPESDVEVQPAEEDEDKGWEVEDFLTGAVEESSAQDHQQGITSEDDSWLDEYESEFEEDMIPPLPVQFVPAYVTEPLMQRLKCQMDIIAHIAEHNVTEQIELFKALSRSLDTAHGIVKEAIVRAATPSAAAVLRNRPFLTTSPPTPPPSDSALYPEHPPHQSAIFPTPTTTDLLQPGPWGYQTPKRLQKRSRSVSSEGKGLEVPASPAPFKRQKRSPSVGLDLEELTKLVGPEMRKRGRWDARGAMRP